MPPIVSPAVTSEDQNLTTCTALDSSWTSLDFYEELNLGEVTHDAKLFLLGPISSLFI